MSQGGPERETAQERQRGGGGHSERERESRGCEGIKQFRQTVKTESRRILAKPPEKQKKEILNHKHNSLK